MLFCSKYEFWKRPSWQILRCLGILGKIKINSIAKMRKILVKLIYTLYEFEKTQFAKECLQFVYIAFRDVILSLYQETLSIFHPELKILTVLLSENRTNKYKILTTYKYLIALIKIAY